MMVDADFELLREQVATARTLMNTAERLLHGVEIALAYAATRGDVYGDAIVTLQKAKKSHEQSIEHLKVTEKKFLEYIKEKSKP